MDIKQIKRIIDLMKANELCEFEMEEEGFRIAIKRRNGNEPQVVLSHAPAPQAIAVDHGVEGRERISEADFADGRAGTGINTAPDGGLFEKGNILDDAGSSEG